MKISYRWFVEVLGFSIPPQELMDTLAMLGHEVDSVVDLGLMENAICIARVESVEPHPASQEEGASAAAKNLTLCRVYDGEQTLQVVCGAPNASAGVVSIMAKPGARLPNGQVIKKTKIRDVASEGMLLAHDELGLGNDHSGIVELGKKAPIGEGYDLLLDLEITANRPDCLSILGLARDVAAARGKKVFFRPERLKETFDPVQEKARVSVKCEDSCPRYTARVISGVQVGPSPGWMQRKLTSVGLRPINNVVDVTNFVLMEMGHPLHAFDGEKLSQHEIIVRKAEAGEKIALLDDTEVDLTPEDMVIADATRPVALAGIMGGADTEVSGETVTVLLESAYFHPGSIRKTARRHKLSTEASYRFERGTDIEGITAALDRAAGLIAELSGGEVCKGTIDTRPKTPERDNIMVRPQRALDYLGIDLTLTQIADLVSAVGCEMIRSDKDILVVSVPSYRVDISREEDIYEEIARLFGYENIPATLPRFQVRANALHPAVALKRRIQDTLSGLGFYEALHTSFLGGHHLETLQIAQEHALKIKNPLSRDHEMLRPDLTPAMLQTLLFNQNRGNENVHLFEVSKTFHFGDMATPFVEKQTLILASMGMAQTERWRPTNSRKVDFFYLKGVVETLLKRLGISDLKFAPGGPEFLHSGRSAYIKTMVDGDLRTVGWIGELDPWHREQMGFKARPVLAEVFVTKLLSRVHWEKTFQEVPRYPAVERDLAFTLDETIPAAQVEECIRKWAGVNLESLFLFDCYQGRPLPEGKKSLAYRLVYRHPERTLKEQEVDQTQNQIISEVGAELNAVLRT